MAEIGYSGKPLYQKLGIKEGMKIQLINAPEEYFDWLGANFSPIVVKSGRPDLTSRHVSGTGKENTDQGL